MFGGVEFTIALLGFGLRVRHNYTETEAGRDLARQIVELESGEREAE
jgi:hypothetical protein